MEPNVDLREKAFLLLQRERELFDLRMKHERVTLWLKLTQSLPQLFADPHTAIAEVYVSLRKTLLTGLRLQRALFVELDGQALRPLLPPGPPRELGPAALSLVQSETAGFCNDPTDPAGAALAEALGLARFIWSRIEVAGRAPVLLAAGFDRAKAKFQQPFDASDAAHLRNATQHLEGLVGNTLLVQELARERDRLQQTNASLERRDRELHALTEELRAANNSLEQRVRERTRELGRRNRDMRLVLDNVAQALLTIDAGGRLAEERSAKVDEWFGSYEGNPRFVEYVARVDRDFARRFALGLEALTEGVLPQELCLLQLPKQLRAGKLILECTYFALPDAAEGCGLLIVIDDITEQVRLTQEEAEHSELLAVFQGLTRDREGFLAFFEEANRLVEGLGRGDLDDATRRRYLHTLKGNSSMIGANIIAELCHRAEGELAREGPIGIEQTIKRLEERWGAVKQTLEMVASDRAKGMVEVPSLALEQLCDEIRRGAPPDQVVERLTFFRFEPVERPLARLSQFARALAKRLDKGDLTVVVEAGQSRVDPRRFAGLWSALVHVVRNAVDHGIEPPADRLAQGKAAEGRLCLRASRTAREWVLEIEDDGRGIDWARVEQLAAARGMPHDTEADLAEAILSDGFSTRSSVTVMSGRGVGMSAVRAQVIELEGTISVRSQPGFGTCWRMAFPLSSARNVYAIASPEPLAPFASPALGMDARAE